MGTDITVTQLGSPADPTYLVRRGDEFWSKWHLSRSEAQRLASELRSMGL